jgi:DegV family protein with EDD domain
LAASETQSVPVTAIDSGQLTLGLGFIVVAAARAAAAGRPLNEILDLIREMTSRTHVVAALDTLEYLRRSGRMNRAVAGLGNLLKIKPLLRMHNGNPTAERVRTKKSATNRLIRYLGDLAPLEQVAFVHAHAPDRAEALRQQVLNLLPEGDVPTVEITPVLGANLGPGAVGFACVSARKG